MEGDCPRFEQFRPYLLLLARVYWGKKFRRRLDSSDIVQQALLRAHQAWSTFRGRESAELAAWLRRILATTIANAARDQAAGKRDVEREQAIAWEIEDSSLRIGGLFIDPGESPSSRAMNLERSVRLAGALNDLPDAQREAVMLRHCDGLSVAEVAAELGRSPAGVASLLRRGLSKLRSELKDESFSGGLD
ncbi:MAG: sigma-70 family RNA polymerase sigma factor [Isosphaeraceae bacterium]|nr:sigma-70 family RNA polymerase sigma factor [Isosphaeraceae bacterium]